VARKLPARRRSTIAVEVLDLPEASVLDVLDHVLAKGVMATGDVTLGVAGIDLIYLRLSTILCAADRLLPPDLRTPKRRRRRSRPASLKRQ
jgi:hypothetical protein